MEMNNKKKAVIVINDIKNKIVSLQMNYSIYRCVKIIENYSSPFINKNNSIFNYRKDVQDFKNNIENISLLYYDFLSLLLGKKMDNANNLEKINKIGYTIKKLLRKTEKSFDKLINIKIDNYEIIKLYSEFAENILNDEDKIEKCKNFLKIKNNNNITEIQEKDYSNFNLEILKKNDDFFYLIILTKNKDLGIISDCSKNLCNLLGYTKSELLGKHINFLLPKIFHERHTNIIKQKSEEHKLNFFEKLYTNSIYSPDFIEKDIYCISKSKLIIPLTMKIYLVNNEENELVYIAEFTRVLTFMNDLYKRINNYQSQKYCVLTDKNFRIQSFTASCLKFL
jgi:PAS domain-containing protein